MGRHEHFGQNDFRLVEALDYDAAAPAPTVGQGLGWYDGANGGAGGWQPQPFVSQYQRGVIGGVFDAGNVSGTWVPDASKGNDQTAVANAGDVTIGVPTAATQGQRLLLILASTGASRVWTLAGGLALLAGYTRTLQLPVGKRGWCLMRYQGSTVGTIPPGWTVTGFSSEQ